MTSKVFPLSVVIPTLNRHSTLLQTIESVCSGIGIPKQIIIIDQSQKPISKDEILLPSEEVEIVILHPAIASSTHARNLGIKAATQEFILFCDDDILVNQETIKLLYDRMTNSQIGLVAALHYKGNVLFEGTRKKNLIKSISGTILGMQKFWRKDGYVIKSTMRGRYAPGIESDVNTEWAMGYFFCVRKSVIACMDHYFDEQLIRYAYAEDLDFSYRYCLEAQKKALKTIIDPKIYVNHLTSKEWRIPKQEEVNYIYANRRYLSYKLFPTRKDYRFAMWLFDHLYWLTQLGKSEYAAEIRYAMVLCRKYKEQIRNGEISMLSNMN